MTLNTSSSEVTLTNVKAAECDVGFRIETQNSLDYTFTQLLLGNCRVGVETYMAGCVHIIGGSASVVDTVFSITGAGTYSIRNFRAEVCGYLVLQGFTQARVSITVDSCETSAGKGKADVFVRGGVSLMMRNGIYAGFIQYEPSIPDLVVLGYGTILLDGVATFDKKIYVETSKSNVYLKIRDCVQLHSNGNVIRRF